MTTPRFVIIAALSLILTALAQAQVTNGGFETGDLTGWQSTGTASAQGTYNSQAPNQGNFQAVLRTPSGGTVFQNTLESFLGLAGGSLNGFNSPSTTGNGGSAIKQVTVTVAQGAMLQLAWNFLPNGSNGAQNDSLLVVLHLASVTANSSAVTRLDAVSNHPTGTPSGYMVFTTGPLSAGTYLLGLVDYDNDSFITGQNFQRPDALIDSVSVINPTAAGVPDAGSTVLLLGVATAAVAVLYRRRVVS